MSRTDTGTPSFPISAFSLSAFQRFSVSLSAPGVTATSCTQATTPNVPTPPKRQPLLGQIHDLTILPLRLSMGAPGHVAALLPG
jgi:hypothetical protein